MTVKEIVWSRVLPSRHPSVLSNCQFPIVGWKVCNMRSPQGLWARDFSGNDRKSLTSLTNLRSNVATSPLWRLDKERLVSLIDCVERCLHRRLAWNLLEHGGWKGAAFGDWISWRTAIFCRSTCIWFEAILMEILLHASCCRTLRPLHCKSAIFAERCCAVCWWQGPLLHWKSLGSHGFGAVVTGLRPKESSSWRCHGCRVFFFLWWHWHLDTPHGNHGNFYGDSGKFLWLGIC